MSYFVIAQAVNTTLVVGVFRSGGDTRFGLILDVSTMWGFSILLGAVAAFFLHASVRTQKLHFKLQVWKWNKPSLDRGALKFFILL